MPQVMSAKLDRDQKRPISPLVGMPGCLMRFTREEVFFKQAGDSRDAESVVRKRTDPTLELSSGIGRGAVTSIRLRWRGVCCAKRPRID